MGRGILAPTPPDTGRGMGALPPVPSIYHRLVQAIDARQSLGRCHTTNHAALNAAWVVGTPSVNVPVAPPPPPAQPPRGS
uniref:Uncharacterized protein n=1 Tax=Oryza glumipatula TaxID=40148 RepID=A0A0E0AAH7_9ORYZ